MKRLILILVASLLVNSTLGCTRPFKPVDMSSYPPQIFEINLDLPLEERLSKIHTYFKDVALPTVNTILGIVQKRIGGPIQMFALK
jgi:acid ceramidase